MQEIMLHWLKYITLGSNVAMFLEECGNRPETSSKIIERVMFAEVEINPDNISGVYQGPLPHIDQQTVVTQKVYAMKRSFASQD